MEQSLSVGLAYEAGGLGKGDRGAIECCRYTFTLFYSFEFEFLLLLRWFAN